MKTVTKEVLKESASKLMFTLTDEQVDTLYNEFAVITKQMELIGKIDGVDEAIPMTFPYEVEMTFLREDKPNNQLKQEEALRNAKDVVEGQIRLPKVVL